MTEKRNYGIDLLRIFSMIMIACHHILYHGGILENAIPFLGTYKAAWMLDIAVCCAVNIYGISLALELLKKGIRYERIVSKVLV